MAEGREYTPAMRILLLNYEFPPLGGGAATASAQIADLSAPQQLDCSTLPYGVKKIFPL